MADNEDSGWCGTKNVIADGTQVVADIEMPHTAEQRPCYACRSWEKDRKRLIEYLLAQGLVAQPDGKFVTPIAKDIPGRKSLILDPKSFGWCRRDCRVTEMEATCSDWELVAKVEDMMSRVVGKK